MDADGQVNVAPAPDQENAGGKTRKTLKTSGGQTGRPALRRLQPHGSQQGGQTGGSTWRALTGTTDTGKKPVKHQSKATKTSSTVRTTDQKKNVTRKTFCDKGVQTDASNTEISLDYKMCTEEEPPVEYWQVLAEQRREALADTLQENEELYTENEALKQKIEELERRLDSKDYFAMMYKIACDDTAKES